MRTKTAALLTAAALLVTSSPATAGTPTVPLPVAPLQAALDDLVSTGSASAALLRVRDGRSEWAGSAGTQDLVTSRPASPNSHFRIGSVTKTFVATVVLQLVDAGELELDDPVARHLPGVVPDGEHITVRQILDHTSGLYDYAHEPTYSTNRWRGKDRFRTYKPQELLDVAFAKPPYFPPGEGWHYSNTNYVVAAVLIERLTGNPYGQEIESRILRPLHLTGTSVPGTNPNLPHPHTHGYANVEGADFTDVTRMNPSLDWAAGEMISTTADLNRFFANLISGPLLSPGARAAMRTTADTGQALFQYGLGLQRFDLPCGETIYGHGGELIGYLTYATTSTKGRQLTLSYNPYRQKPSQEALVALFTTAYCPA